MRNRFILLICAAMLLFGCITNSSLTKSSKGMTMEQLVAQQSTVKFANINKVIDAKYPCYRCDGQPTRTYTDEAGNEVAVYLYWISIDMSATCDSQYNCDDPYSFCNMAEQQFEFANGVVTRARWVLSDYTKTTREPFHSNACDEHPPYIEDSEVNTIWYGYTSW